jgi:hypothetical protein
MAALCYVPGRLRFVLVTTSREADAAGPTTRDVVEEQLQMLHDERFVHVHCDDGTDTCKADQLNFALRRLGLQDSRRDDLFVGVYDADSTPDPRTLLYLVDRYLEDCSRVAFQQVPFYFHNTDELPGGLRGLYLRSRPLHNALFALSVEVPGMRSQVRLVELPCGSPSRVVRGWLSHALGHGQFFRIDVLHRLGGFRPPSCDTQFGHALAFAGVALRPHPMLDVGETPDSVRTLMKQGVVWFNSVNTFWRTKRFVDSLQPENRCQAASWFMMARLVHSNLAWAFYPVIYLVCLAWCALAANSGLAAYGLACWAVYLIPVAIILASCRLWNDLTRHYAPVRGFSWVSSMGILLMFGVEKLGSCVSPWIWVVYRLRQLAMGKPIPLKKTERSPSFSRLSGSE